MSAFSVHAVCQCSRGAQHYLLIAMKGGSLDLASLMLGLLCLGQLLLEMDKALLSRRQVSALPGELLLQLG